MRARGRHRGAARLRRREEPPHHAAARRDHGQRPVHLSRLYRPAHRRPLGQAHAGIQPRAVHALPGEAARVRRARRLDLPPVRPGRAASHGIPARPRRVRRRAGRRHPARVPRRLSEVLQPGRGRREGKLRLRALLEESFRAAVAAADPLKILGAHLPRPPKGRTFVAAAGKAAASMALAVEQKFSGSVDGIAVTRYRHGLPTKRIRVVEAGHPVPDEAGENAAKEILAEVKELGRDDLLLALLSGGGSSLLSLPAAGISMSELKALTGRLLKSGAEIREMNTVRKHLSAIQGGRLAAACRAPVVALIISDV